MTLPTKQLTALMREIAPGTQKVREYCAACREETTHAVEVKDGWEWRTCVQCGNSHAERIYLP